MSEADEILARARARENARDAAHVPIDYAAANKEFRRQKAALTRAINSGDRDKVLIACTNAVREWNKPGRAWPDNWSRWQIALDDMFPVFQGPRLEDLS